MEGCVKAQPSPCALGLSLAPHHPVSSIGWDIQGVFVTVTKFHFTESLDFESSNPYFFFLK